MNPASAEVAAAATTETAGLLATEAAGAATIGQPEASRRKQQWRQGMQFANSSSSSLEIFQQVLAKGQAASAQLIAAGEVAEAAAVQGQIAQVEASIARTLMVLKKLGEVLKGVI